MSDGNETLSIEEVSRLLSRLRQADHLRLAALAQTWISGCPRREPVELLNEALSRILSGARPWPVDVPLPAFLSQVMRSIASQWRHEDQREPLLDDADRGSSISRSAAHSVSTCIRPLVPARSRSCLAVSRRSGQTRQGDFDGHLPPDATSRR